MGTRQSMVRSTASSAPSTSRLKKSMERSPARSNMSRRGTHGTELSDPGYVDAQEADALCRSASGRWRTNDPLVAGKNEGCPDPCAYTCCNCGQKYTVQVRMFVACGQDTRSRAQWSPPDKV